MVCVDCAGGCQLSSWVVAGGSGDAARPGSSALGSGAADDPQPPVPLVGSGQLTGALRFLLGFGSVVGKGFSRVIQCIKARGGTGFSAPSNICFLSAISAVFVCRLAIC